MWDPVIIAHKKTVMLWICSLQHKWWLLRLERIILARYVELAFNNFIAYHWSGLKSNVVFWIWIWNKPNKITRTKVFYCYYQSTLASYKISEITPWGSLEKLRSKIYGINRIRWTTWESSTLYIFLFWRYTRYTICIFTRWQCLWIKFVFQLSMTSLGIRVQTQHKFWRPSA